MGENISVTTTHECKQWAKLQIIASNNKTNAVKIIWTHNGFCNNLYTIVIFLYNDYISVIIIIHVGCSFGQTTKKCSSDICDSIVCTNYRNAVCYPDECANCFRRYFNGNRQMFVVRS